MFVGLTILFTALGMSRESVLSCWMILEINTLSFIVVLFFDKREQRVSFSYFIIQRATSGLILFLASLGLSGGGNHGNVAFLALRMKMGAFPFFRWFIFMAKSISWDALFLLRTFQKLLPLYIIRGLGEGVIWAAVISGSTVAAVLIRWREVERKKILGFSRLFNLGWIIARYDRPQALILFSFTYFTALALVVFIMKEGNYWNAAQLGQRVPRTEKIALALGFISIGGFPPLAGFWGKLTVATNLLQESRGIAAYLVVTAVAILYIYFQLIMPTLLGRRTLKNSRGRALRLSLACTLPIPLFVAYS